MLNIVLLQLNNLVFQHPAGNIQYPSFSVKPSIIMWGMYQFLCFSASTSAPRYSGHPTIALSNSLLPWPQMLAKTPGAWYVLSQ